MKEQRQVGWYLEKYPKRLQICEKMKEQRQVGWYIPPNREKPGTGAESVSIVGDVFCLGCGKKEESAERMKPFMAGEHFGLKFKCKSCGTPVGEIE